MHISAGMLKLQRMANWDVFRHRVLLWYCYLITQ